MKLNDIHIRDPFIFAEDGTYYLYGTRAGHPLGPRQGDGLDVYTSKDLVEWSEPYECFTTPEGFWADRDFFAPEVHKWKGSYYMFASFRSLDHNRASQILKADSPDTERTAKYILKDFREGRLGKFILDEIEE